MSTSLITNYFRLHNVKQFRESITETANSVYYVFASRHTAYSTGDSSIPDINNTVETGLQDAFNEMIFGKRVTSNSACVVTSRYNWTSNTVYDAYRSNEDLTDKQFFVCVDHGSGYSIFKCLDNNGNAVSTVMPDYTQTSADDSYYSTLGDGYVWKWMYNVDTTTFSKFATADYMPIVPNANVSGNAVSGSIDVITVTKGGSNYNTTLSGNFANSETLRIGGSTVLYKLGTNASAENNFYENSFLYLKTGTGAGEGRRIVNYIGATKTVEILSAFNVSPDVTTTYEITPGVIVSGDGEGFVARALVNTYTSNSISSIEILSRGNGYTYATALATGNTGGVSNAAILYPILSPKGGHGYDAENELNGSAICISVDFANTETNTIPVTNDFRTVGLLKDPHYANVTLTIGLNAGSGSFQIGETVTQANTGATGIVTDWNTIDTLTITQVDGIVMTGNSTVNYISGANSGAAASVVSYLINGETKNFMTFDQRHKYSYTPVSGTFSQDEKIYQYSLELSNAIFHSTESSNLCLTHVKGVINTGNVVIGVTSGAIASLTYHYPPDIIPNSGEILYLENGSPISRAASQTETIKFILQF